MAGNEEPFRVTNVNGAKLYHDADLNDPSDDAPADGIVPGRYLDNNVVYIGEPYDLYASAADLEPLDATHKLAFGGAVEADEMMDDDGIGAEEPIDDLDYGAPQSFAAPQPDDSPLPQMGGVGGAGAAAAAAQANQAAPVDARHAIHDISYTDRNGAQQRIGYNQDNMLANVLTGTPSHANGGANTNAFNDVRMGRRRSDSQGSHVSSHSRTSQHSHRSHRSHRSHHSHHSQHPQQTYETYDTAGGGPVGDDDGMGMAYDNDELLQDAGSDYSDEYAPSVGTFVPLPRQQDGDGDGVKMSYKKGMGHSIPASQLKSPLIYNQIANDIQIKRSKDRGVKKIKDNIIIQKFGDARPQLEVEYFSMSKGVRGGLVVVIPFFNEPATELEATLRHLHRTYSYLQDTDPAWANRPCDVCMIQDGWYKASDSMQRYLKKMFPKQYYIDPDSGKQVDIPNGDNERGGSVSDNSDDDDGKNSEFDGVTPTGGGGHLDDAGSSVSKRAKSHVSYAPTTLPEVSKYWWEFLPEFTDYDKSRDGPVTYVFEKTHDNPSFFELKWPVTENGKIDKRMETQKTFRITLIVKIDNRRKHNSHEWFLGENGFSDAYNARYLFATDAFTLFEPSCMYHMVHYLDTHPDTAAVTGRQRAMNRKQQDLDGKEFALSIAYVLRMTQTFDFELTSGVFNPVYGVCGFLPVIPGPCGLYRCSDVGQNKARYWYFDIVNAEPTETGLILGNLRIAEDRILTYAAILKVKDYRRMAFVPAGLFFFETETDLNRFIFQRRRWINGTFAGFIYILIAAPYHVWGWHANFWVKFKVWLLLVINFAQLSTVIWSPAISFSILNTSLTYLLFWFTDEALSLANNIMLFGWVLWCLHVIIHNTAKFSHIIMKLLYGWSFLISSSLIVTYFLLFAIEQKDVYEGLLVDGMKPEELDFVLGLMAFGTVVPFSCQYMVGGWEAVLILGQSVVHYFLSFHLMIPWFTSYAFARCWDLTWGNRPAEGEMDEVEAEKFEAAEIMKAKFLQYSRLVALALILSNIGLFLLPQYYIILTMSGFLMATAFFMGSSFIILISQTFCGEVLTNCMSRSLVEYRKAEERERQEQLMYGGDMQAMGANNFNRGDDEDSDDEYLVIPQEYQAHASVPQRYVGDHERFAPEDQGYDGNEFDNGYYDENGVWIDYDPKNARHNDFTGTMLGQNDMGDYDDDYDANYPNDANDAYGGYREYNDAVDENGNNLDQGGYYDEDGNWIEDDGQGGYYDENGVWFDADGYDENGGYYDENGNYVDANGGYYDEQGNYIEAQYDENGNYYDPNAKGY